MHIMSMATYMVQERLLLLVAVSVFSSVSYASPFEERPYFEDYDCPAKVRPNHTNFCECNAIFEIKCSNLEFVPVFTESKRIYNGFDAREQSIPQLPAGIFQNLLVKKIVLDFNPIGDEISAGAFDYTAEALEELSLGACGIEFLPRGLVDKMRSLHFLHLWGNRIKIIQDSYFQRLGQLQELLLWGNDITRVTDQTFTGLGQLRKLDLDDNNVTSLSQDNFKPLPNLQVLLLGNNKIPVIHGYTFKHLSNLRTLKLNGNKITVIHEEGLYGLKKLTTLALQNNTLTYFFTKTFKDQRKLIALHLQDNSIKLWKAAIDPLESLQIFDLSRNDMDALAEELFNSQRKIQQLFLDQNKLRNFKKGILHPEAKPKTLSLVGNQIQCTCGAAWLAEMAEGGTEVWGMCQNSPLKREPVAIADRRVYVKGNCSLSRAERLL